MAIAAELGGISVVLLGLFLFLIAIGATVALRQLLMALASGIPIVGGWLASHIDPILASVENKCWDWFKAGGRALATWILLPIIRVVAVLGEIRNAFDAIPHMLRLAISDSLGVAYEAWSGIWNAAIGNLSRGVSAALTFITSQLHAQANSIIHVEGEALTGIHGTRATLNARVGEINNAVAAQNAYTTAVKDYAATRTDQLRQALAPAIAFNGSQLRAQAQSIVHVEAEARDWATAAGSAASAHADAVGQAAIAAGIAGSLTQVKPLIHTVAQSLDDYKTDCGDPLCSGLLGAAKDLSALEGLIGDGLLVALILAAIHDPTATAKATEPVLRDIIEPVVGGIRAVL